MGKKSFIEAFRISISYILVACLWITFSDYILGVMVKSKKFITTISIFKGWFFVIVTGTILFLTIKAKLDKIYKFEEQLIKTNKEINRTYQKLKVARDILKDQNVKLKQQQHTLIRLAYYDFLTSLPNRQSFYEMLGEYINIYRQTDKKLAVAIMDIDNFKNINDTAGHTKGDQLIKDISNEILKNIKGGFVSRIGGDEFGFIFCEEDEKVAEKKIISMMNTIKRNWTIDGYEFYVTASIGACIYPADGCDISTLIKNADTALNRAKSNGKNTFCFFNEQINDEVVERIEIENRLRYAIKNNQLILFYQPIYKLNSGNVSGAEALLRWYHPEKGIIAPNKFIGIAEESGLIIPIGAWVIKQAIEQLEKWNEISKANFTISVNISAKQFQERKLINLLESLTRNANINKNITIEITESTAIENISHIKCMLNEIRNLGIKIALDDFGTGYSSLNYLQELPIDVVKIDRSFIANIVQDERKVKIIRTLIDIAHILNLEVVAEGVENSMQMEILKNLNCDYIQGYLIGKPVPSIEFEKEILIK